MARKKSAVVRVAAAMASVMWRPAAEPLPLALALPFVVGEDADVIGMAARRRATMSTSNLQPPPSPWGVKLEAQAWNELSASRLRSEVQPGAPLVPRLRHHKAPIVRDSATGGVGRCFTCEPAQ